MSVQLDMFVIQKAHCLSGTPSFDLHLRPIISALRPQNIAPVNIPTI